MMENYVVLKLAEVYVNKRIMPPKKYKKLAKSGVNSMSGKDFKILMNLNYLAMLPSGVTPVAVDDVINEVNDESNEVNDVFNDTGPGTQETAIPVVKNLSSKTKKGDFYERTTIEISQTQEYKIANFILTAFESAKVPCNIVEVDVQLRYDVYRIILDDSNDAGKVMTEKFLLTVRNTTGIKKLDIINEDGFIKVVVYKEFDADDGYNLTNLKGEMSYGLALNDNSELSIDYVARAIKGDNVSTIFVGVSGSGKTYIVRIIIYRHCMKYEPGEMGLVLIDIDNQFRGNFNANRNLILPVAKDVDSAMSTIQALIAIYESRDNVDVTFGDVPHDGYGIILMYFGELKQLLRKVSQKYGKEIHDEIYSDIVTLSNGRKKGMVPLADTQSVIVEETPVIESVDIRFCGKVARKEQSAANTGIPGLKLNLSTGKGHMAGVGLSKEDEYIMLQVAKVDDGYIENRVPISDDMEAETLRLLANFKKWLAKYRANVYKDTNYEGIACSSAPTTLNTKNKGGRPEKQIEGVELALYLTNLDMTEKESSHSRPVHKKYKVLANDTVNALSRMNKTICDMENDNE